MLRLELWARQKSPRCLFDISYQGLIYREVAKGKSKAGRLVKESRELGLGCLERKSQCMRYSPNLCA